MIYFDSNKQAYAFEIPEYICTVKDNVWAEYAGTDKWDIIDGVFTDITNTSEYKEKKTEEREADFKSKFFYINGFGWYRKQPKGYQSAIESLNTAFNRFVLMQQAGLEEFPAGVFIFYSAPDFTKPEECTEDWLINHQYRNQAMTVLEFGNFYATFTDAWNTEEHE